MPLIVQTPETMGKPKRIDDLVYLFDITSTMLQFTGSKAPDYFDSIPLPGLPGIPHGRELAERRVESACRFHRCRSIANRKVVLQ